MNSARQSRGSLPAVLKEAACCAARSALTELLNHPALTADMREPLAPADDDYSQVWASAAI